MALKYLFTNNLSTTFVIKDFNVLLGLAGKLWFNYSVLDSYAKGLISYEVLKMMKFNFDSRKFQEWL